MLRATVPHIVRFSIAPVRSLGLEHPLEIELTERGVETPIHGRVGIGRVLDGPWAEPLSQFAGMPGSDR